MKKILLLSLLLVTLLTSNAQSDPFGSPFGAKPNGPGLISIEGLTETNGGMLYGTADNAYAWLAAGAQGTLLMGNGAGAPSWLGAGSSGQFLLGAGAADPIWTTQATLASLEGLTISNGSLIYGTAADTLASLTAGTANYLLQANGAAAPTWINDLNTAITIGSAYIYRAGGTDVADADVVDTLTITNLSQVQDVTATAATVNTIDDGLTTQILVGGGASVSPVWTTATGTGAPVRAISPTFSTSTSYNDGAGGATGIMTIDASGNWSYNKNATFPTIYGTTFFGVTHQSNTSVQIELDNDNNGTSYFQILNGADARVFQVDEASVGTLGHATMNEELGALQIIADADSDAGGDTDDTFQVVLTPNATPTLATWGFTSTQSAGYTFDKAVAVTGNVSATTYGSDSSVSDAELLTVGRDFSKLDLTADTVLTEAQIRANKYISNQGDADEADITLPAVSYVINVIFSVEEVLNIEINPPSGEIFDLDGTALDADDCVDSDSTVGSKIAATRLQIADGTWRWSLDTIRGVWTDTGASD